MTGPAHKSIIFFSLHYPFDVTDSYLDEEIEGISYVFNKVVIISANTFSDERRKIPANAVVYRYNPEINFWSRIKSVGLLFNPMFYADLRDIIIQYKINLSWNLIKELFAFYIRARVTKEFVEEVIARENIDKHYLLLYSYWMIESALAAVMLKSQQPGIKVISKAHSQDVYFERSPVKYHPFRKYILNHLDHLYFISENAREYFSDKHKLAEEEKAKTSVSRIGITGNNREFIAKAPSGTLKIVSVGYIQKLKRVDLVVDALALIDILKIEWTHMGHSNQSEADFEQIKNYAAQKLSGKGNIQFYFTGKTQKKEMFDLYERSKYDFFLNVSETEGIPVSMMEAMSFSVPVIGTNVGGVAEIVEDERNGFLLSSYPDAREVANAILRFADLPAEQRNKLRQAAYKTWNEKYNAQKNYEEIKREIDKLMEAR